MKYRLLFSFLVPCVFSLQCTRLEIHPGTPAAAPEAISVEQVAKLLSTIPLEAEHMQEVHDAATASAANGYDEEYRMEDLFRAPGTGVGASAPTKAGTYAHPLRDALRDAFLSTKSAGGGDASWLDSLALSDVQIYWPYSESWDGSRQPVITYDPGEGALSNEGFLLREDGGVAKVLVDEQMAAERPVWVINRNSDAEYKTLELRRREDPSWGQGGGDILVKSPSEDSEFRTLVLRSFCSHRQYDSWFAGAAEFFVKLGAVENFMASTEAEMRLYDPAITDFMIVVRRKQVGKELPFNAILVSEWSDQLSSCALMMVEDDGGTRTTWKCSAMVKIESKSYGFELEIPLYSRDDIVWRGSLTRNYIERNSGKSVRFGDVDLVLELI